MSSDESDVFIQAMETSPTECDMLSLNYPWDIQDKRKIYEGSWGEILNRDVDLNSVASWS